MPAFDRRLTGPDCCLIPQASTRQGLRSRPLGRPGRAVRWCKHLADVAQLVERRHGKAEVSGSIPDVGSGGRRVL